jgi:hypothetical protein
MSNGVSMLASFARHAGAALAPEPPRFPREDSPLDTHLIQPEQEE